MTETKHEYLTSSSQHNNVQNLCPAKKVGMVLENISVAITMRCQFGEK